MFFLQKALHGFPRFSASGFFAASSLAFADSFKGFEGAAQNLVSLSGIRLPLDFSGVWVLCNTHTLSPTGEFSC